MAIIGTKRPTALPARLEAATTIGVAATLLAAAPAIAAPASAGADGRPGHSAAADNGRGSYWHGNSRVDNGHHDDGRARGHGHDRSDPSRNGSSDGGDLCAPRECTGPR